MPCRRRGCGWPAPMRRASATSGGWLTTVVARICLDTLRARRLRGETGLDAPRVVEPTESFEHEAMLADSMGLALLVVLDTLAPAERIAFVLHDMFDLSFDAIAPIVDRSPAAARQLASRARRRIQRAPAPDADRQHQRAVVEAFLAAARRGDVAGLVALLDPDAVLRGDRRALPGAPHQLRGADAIARRAAAAGARAARPALVDGEIGVVVAPLGRLLLVLRYTIVDDTIVEIEAIGAPDRLAQLSARTARRAAEPLSSPGRLHVRRCPRPPQRDLLHRTLSRFHRLICAMFSTKSASCCSS